MKSKNEIRFEIGWIVFILWILFWNFDNNEYDLYDALILYLTEGIVK